MGTQWTKLMNLENFLAIQTEAQKDLRLLPAEWLALLSTLRDENGDVQQLVNTSGEITELNSTDILVDTTAIKGTNASIAATSDVVARDLTSPTIGVRPSLANTTNARKRLGVAEALLSGGTLGNVPLVPALAGNFAVVQPIGIWCDTKISVNLIFQDEDDTSMEPVQIATGGGLTSDAHVDHIVEIGHHDGAANEQSSNTAELVTFNVAADNKAAEMDISGGSGAELVVMWYWYWYET